MTLMKFLFFLSLRHNILTSINGIYSTKYSVFLFFYAPNSPNLENQIIRKTKVKIQGFHASSSSKYCSLGYVKL